MWIEKLSDGVLCVQTALGPRYIRPSFWQRFYLAWVFRNFGSLPEQVLSERQRRLVSELCRAQNFITPSFSNGLLDAPIIGIVERRPSMLVESVPPKRSVVRPEPAGASLADQQGS
jgi:hypothetical protein